MGSQIPCCTNLSCTKTYSRTAQTKGKPTEEFKESSLLPHKPSVYHFPTFCKILKSVSEEDIRSVYTFEKRLGFGRFGVVNQIYLNKDPDKKFAVKSINIQSIMPELKLIENELDILMQVDHPNIIQYHETYNDGKFLHIVMELCTGGELFDRIIKQGKFSEAEAAKIMEKILSAISYLHNLGICHRDLKPENFIFSNPSPDAEIKIIDFGLSIKAVKEVQMKDVVGTPFYVAPEVLVGEYTNACDIWSVGVILYIMLSGKPPFTGETSSEVLSKVSNSPVYFPEKNWHGISNRAKDLIEHMLQKVPSARYTAKQCLDHKWFETYEDTTSLQLDLRLLKRLKNFRRQPRFKQEVLGIVIKFLHPLVMQHYTESFRAMDQNEDGYITVPDLISSAKANNMEITVPEAEALLKLVDFDKDGNFSISDFVAASMAREHICSEEIAKLAFDHFDVQKDGFINMADLRKAFKRGTKMYTDPEIQEILAEVDLNKDGRITFLEFRELLLS
jgi:calcium-dependent protein kinase